MLILCERLMRVGALLERAHLHGLIQAADKGRVHVAAVTACR